MAQLQWKPSIDTSATCQKKATSNNCLEGLVGPEQEKTSFASRTSLKQTVVPFLRHETKKYHK